MIHILDTSIIFAHAATLVRPIFSICNLLIYFHQLHVSFEGSSLPYNGKESAPKLLEPFSLVTRSTTHALTKEI